MKAPRSGTSGKRASIPCISSARVRPFAKETRRSQGGLEYRFTPHIGIFGEIAYVLSNLSNNNFIQTKFGLRFVFQAKN